MSLRKAVACIKKYKNFLITTHTNLEGDAIGSELAFHTLLKKLGKGAYIINEDKVPSEYGFLLEKEKVNKISLLGRYNPKKRIKFDCFVVLDCSDLDRTGTVYRINTANTPILNIDHHISNQGFGEINWVEPDSSSCSEMIYKLYKKLRLPIDRDTAIFLYVGMLTDTGSFRYSNTTSLTHKAVSELLRYNFDIPQIYKNIYENIPLQDAGFLGKVSSGIKFCASGKVAWFKIKRKALKKRRLTFDLTEVLLSFARAIKDVEVCVLFKENLGVKDEVRVNLRSLGKVDVNEIASFFGGGGHKTASGVTVRGKIDQVIRKVLAKIKKTIGPS